MVKKRKWIILAAVVAAALIVCFLFAGKRPFKDLQAADVVSASVHLSPPDKTVEINDIPKLVEYLNNVVIYQPDESYRLYAGQGVTFTLELTDGSVLRVMPFGSFFLIDGKGYRCEYEPSEALNAYANSLMYE